MAGYRQCVWQRPFLLGNSVKPRQPDLDIGLLADLPAPHIQDPAIIVAEPQSKALSCAELTLAAEQGPVVNALAAALAAPYLHNIVVDGYVTAFATQFNSDPPVARSRLATAAELAPYWDSCDLVACNTIHASL